MRGNSTKWKRNYCEGKGLINPSSFIISVCAQLYKPTVQQQTENIKKVEKRFSAEERRDRNGNPFCFSFETKRL